MREQIITIINRSEDIGAHKRNQTPMQDKPLYRHAPLSQTQVRIKDQDEVWVFTVGFRSRM